MPLAPCARCKKLFNKNDSAVCTGCEADEQADFDKVRDILEEYPNMSSEEVAERAQVDLSVVKRMLDKGIIAVMTGQEQVKCGRCGAPAISMARKLCQSCLEHLNAEMIRARASIRLGVKKETRISGFNVRGTFEDKRR